MNGFRFILILTCILMLSTSIAFAASKTPPGSFVKWTISSVDDLISAVKEDPVVAQRYAKHFGMTVPELIYYFENHLTMVRLEKSGIHTIYFIGRGGRIITRTARLGAGQKIFIAPDGTPVISVRCGNPIATKLPQPPVPQALQYEAPKTYGMTTDVDAELLPVESELLVDPVEVAMEPLAPEPVWEKVAAVPIQIAPLEQVGKLIIPAIVGASVVSSTGGEPVPEPSSLLILVAGGIPLVMHLKKRRH